MARRASLVVAVVALSGLTVAGAALARQNSTFQPPAAPLAPPAQPAPTAPVAPGDARPAQPTQVTPAVANPNPPASPKPTAPKPAATVKPPEPTKRGRYSVAILQALDKVTTETMRFEVPVGQPIRYKTLIFTVRACETAASDEIAPETSAYVVIDTQPKAQAGRAAPPGRQIYKGWMYASTPGLHPLEHPVYDAWLIACKQSLPDAPPAKP
jgi:hypothetical protein